MLSLLSPYKLIAVEWIPVILHYVKCSMVLLGAPASLGCKESFQAVASHLEVFYKGYNMVPYQFLQNELLKLYMRLEYFEDEPRKLIPTLLLSKESSQTS